MNEELELAKVSLKNANNYADIKGNPVVESVLMPMVKAHRRACRRYGDQHGNAEAGV